MEEHILYKNLQEPIKIYISNRDIEDWINFCNDITTLESLASHIKNHINFLKNQREYYRYEDYVK